MAYHLSLFKTSSFFFFIILPAILCQENRQYADCRQPFRCSNLQNIEYPFWGGNRQDFCGLPGFQLDCSGDAPLITIMNLAYRVLSIDSGPAQTLTVARNDLWTDSCAALLQNTTLDFARFDYVRGGYENVTINYGCTNIPGQTVPIQNQFDCPSGGGRRNTRSYFVMENGLTIDFNVSGVTCDSNIFVPVNESSGLALRSLSVSVSDLRAALTSGFELRWTANNTDCRQCTESGGICGSNTNTGLFACHCANQTYPSVCGGKFFSCPFL